jgi:SAM-dependent methyltransferase
MNDWYETHAQKFFDQTVEADLAHLHERFLTYVNPGGKILDAGCGSGRDSKAFIERGYEVTAIDASKAMVQLASNWSGIRVLHMQFEEIPWPATFDGVWACASLLHVPRCQISSVLTKLVTAMVSGGILYVSFKLGEGERFSKGRFFNDYDEEGLSTLLALEEGLEVIDIFKSSDARPGARQQWINALARKTGSDGVFGFL